MFHGGGSRARGEGNGAAGARPYHVDPLPSIGIRPRNRRRDSRPDHLKRIGDESRPLAAVSCTLTKILTRCQIFGLLPDRIGIWERREYGSEFRIFGWELPMTWASGRAARALLSVGFALAAAGPRARDTRPHDSRDRWLSADSRRPPRTSPGRHVWTDYVYDDRGSRLRDVIPGGDAAHPAWLRIPATPPT